MTPVVIVPRNDPEAALWRTTMEVAGLFRELPWAVVGGQMIMLLELESGRPAGRATRDLDAIVDVRAMVNVTRLAAERLQEAGFAPSAEHPHRFLRGLDTVDLLAPDHLGGRVDLTTIPPLVTTGIAGGSRALETRRAVDVQIAGIGPTELQITSLAGATRLVPVDRRSATAMTRSRPAPTLGRGIARSGPPRCRRRRPRDRPPRNPDAQDGVCESSARRPPSSRYRDRDLPAESNAMSTSRRFVGLGIVIGLAVGLLAGSGAVLAQSPGASTGAAVAPTVPGSGVTIGPAATAGSGSTGSGVAIAYPYPIYAGSPGIAPDHTIVVTGVGQADVASDRATAQRSALAAALADAKAQATVIAGTVGVSITGVVSVSASVGPFEPMPMAGGGTVQAPGQLAPVPAPLPPVWPSQLSVAVTVVYGID